MSQSSNRRRVPRRSFHAGVGCLFHGDYSVVRAQQVGQGGMSIVVGFETKVGERLVVSFRIPNGSLVCVRGIIRYRDQLEKQGHYGVGLQFENLDFQFKRELRNFVALATNENVDF